MKSFSKVWDSFSASLKVQQRHTFIAVQCMVGNESCSVRLRYTQIRLKSGLKYTNQCLSFNPMKTRNCATQFQLINLSHNNSKEVLQLLFGKNFKIPPYFEQRSPIFNSSQRVFQSLYKFRAVSQAEFAKNIVYYIVSRHRGKLVTLKGRVREGRGTVLVFSSYLASSHKSCKRILSIYLIFTTKLACLRMATEYKFDGQIQVRLPAAVREASPRSCSGGLSGTGPENTTEIESRQTASMKFMYFLQVVFPVVTLGEGVVLLVNRGRDQREII